MLRNGWLLRFPEVLRAGKRTRIQTLSDARKYILRLKRSERDRPEWRIAGEMLASSAASGDVTLADIAMRRALAPHEVKS